MPFTCPFSPAIPTDRSPPEVRPETTPLALPVLIFPRIPPSLTATFPFSFSPLQPTFASSLPPFASIEARLSLLTFQLLQQFRHLLSQIGAPCHSWHRGAVVPSQSRRSFSNRNSRFRPPTTSCSVPRSLTHRRGCGVLRTQNTGSPARPVFPRSTAPQRGVIPEDKIHGAHRPPKPAPPQAKNRRTVKQRLRVQPKLHT